MSTWKLHQGYFVLKSLVLHIHQVEIAIIRQLDKPNLENVTSTPYHGE